MASITTYHHFAKDPNYIPNAIPEVNNAEGVKLSGLIEQYEREYLINILGWDLYELFVNNLEDGGIYEAINEGATFVSTLGIKKKWDGFNTPGRSPVACYIYLFYQRSNASSTFGIGEANSKTETADRTAPGTKMRAAWNRMVELNFMLHEFLIANQGEYPTYIGINNPPVGMLYGDTSMRKFQELFIKQRWI